ncbi:MAG: hypothetical protein CM15mV139_190 [Caudoviricetes sp.]|nr:MAG: hypothetical protein CM15mV139_190 [Caudoviricetes sp.]
MMDVYRQKYDGYIPNEIAGALRGHMEDSEAEDMIRNQCATKVVVNHDFEAKILVQKCTTNIKIRLYLVELWFPVLVTIS